ncbi:hypothetical protein GCM10028801_27920 [Nocardioides maradonensis]
MSVAPAESMVVTSTPTRSCDGLTHAVGTQERPPTGKQIGAVATTVAETAPTCLLPPQPIEA